MWTHLLPLSPALMEDTSVNRRQGTSGSRPPYGRDSEFPALPTVPGLQQMQEPSPRPLPAHTRKRVSSRTLTSFSSEV